MKNKLHYKLRLLNMQLNNGINNIKEQPKLIKEYKIKFEENDKIFDKMHEKAEFNNYELAGVKYIKNNNAIITIYYY